MVLSHTHTHQHTLMSASKKKQVQASISSFFAPKAGGALPNPVLGSARKRKEDEGEEEVVLSAHTPSEKRTKGEQ